MNLINRWVLPIIYQEERTPGAGSEFGLGDFTYEAFFSPAKPGKVIWEADSGQQWIVPFGGGFGKLVRFGKFPVDFKGQVFFNAEEPDGAAEWSIQLQCKLLFTK